MDRLALLDRLRSAPGLRRLPLGDLDLLASRSRLRSFAPGEVLMEEGEPGDGVFVLAEGQVAIRKRIGPDEPQVLAVREAGDWVGEMALLDDEPRSATAVAQGRVAALWIPSAVFLDAVTSQAPAAVDLLRALAARLRQSDTLVIETLTGKTEALAERNRRLARENRRLRGELEERHGFERYVGSSAAARRVRALARRAADNRLPVLILGETGTGKEVIARAIHGATDVQMGPRAGPPISGRQFVALNCALLTESLLESELFGHARGAFTGAVAAKPGLVEAADGGTLFLDEIADMPLALQGALLRFLELGEFRRIGETKSRRADARVIAATHHDLEDAVRRGAFRRDLFYRLDVIRIVLPPLRERREDLAELVAALSARTAERLGAPPLRILPETIDALGACEFPGNVRELENEIERLYALGVGDAPVGPDALSERIHRGETDQSTGYADAVRRFKERFVARALAEAHGNRARAAERLCVHRSNLVRMIRDLGLDEPADGEGVPSR